MTPLPLPNSYWVLPGRLLAGEHPSGNGESDSRARLERLCGVGINYFIDLTEAGEMPDYRGLLRSRSHYLRCAIRDQEVPADAALMQRLQAQILKALALGRCIYIHCRAGIGRTGLVVGCHLVEGGLSGPAALARLNQLWQQSERAKSWPSVPQTEEQADYVLHWSPHRALPARSQSLRRRTS
jgi:Dual specificity phosphatase, catalytic domain